mmetsp:Transcript_3958/g.7789  ORF Transcript_3958/g.7789 Transcript_3958/m.7789 type:complete len:89 (-) Transcript_3958:155-421(-)
MLFVMAGRSTGATSELDREEDSPEPLRAADGAVADCEDGVSEENTIDCVMLFGSSNRRASAAGDALLAVATGGVDRPSRECKLLTTSG